MAVVRTEDLQNSWQTLTKDFLEVISEGRGSNQTSLLPKIHPLRGLLSSDSRRIFGNLLMSAAMVPLVQDSRAPRYLSLVMKFYTAFQLNKVSLTYSCFNRLSSWFAWWPALWPILIPMPCPMTATLHPPMELQLLSTTHQLAESRCR